MSDKQKSKPNQNEQKQEQKMSKKDIENLMGVYDSVYTRKNGAVRRK